MLNLSRPNIVLFLQDDQDFLNGRAALRAMPQALAIVGDRGIFADQWFVHTPVCCPSRAELLTGRYFHNIRMPAPGGGCMHVQTGVPHHEDKVNEHSFAKYLVELLGYQAAWVGKEHPFPGTGGADSVSMCSLCQGSHACQLAHEI